ncbi:MAG: hypothetical protein DSZ32_07425 [Gammaproteobacteria bacterium]|nr:MAG: hypothetical protein DSZ32_07425 [Gammaproteobacteria bacterium]
MKLKLFAMLFASSVCVSLSGCGVNDGVRDLEQFTKQAYTATKPEISPLPAIKPYERYEYSSAQKVDPFDRENLVPANEQTDGRRAGYAAA